MTEETFLKNHPLPAMLPVLVELAMDEVRKWTPDQRIEYARAQGQAIAEQSDVLLFSGKKGEAGQLAAKLARAIACLSFQPGGVKLFGHHWQAEPDQSDPMPEGGGLDFADLFTFTDDLTPEEP